MNKARTIAVIPVRGGSKGIPRKNARLLNGRPLLSYSIERALACGRFDDVVVSTEDEELAHLAARYGASTVERPMALADDKTTLDDVVVDAVVRYEKLHGCEVGHVATIQATSPLLQSSTIARAVDVCLDEGRDTVLTVVNETHLAWTRGADGALIPDYTARLNRQELPPRYKETGAVVVCSRAQIDAGTRFGENISIVEVDKRESVDIDDRYDWWIAEKQLARKRLVFRVDGYRSIGMGHVYRTLTLADYKLDHDVSFVLRDVSDVAIKLLRSRHYPVVVFEGDAEAEAAAVLSQSPDIIVNDRLDTDLAYMQALRGAFSGRVVNFEDLGDGARLADAVINEMYLEKKAVPGAFVGHEYVCLRDEFYTTSPKPFAERVGHVLLIFGGTDPAGLTEKTLGWLLPHLDKEVAVTVILGPGKTDTVEIEALCEATPIAVELVRQTAIITRYMARADVAITSGGRTVFELASLGVPMIVVNQNERENTHNFANSAPGVINLGLGTELQKATFLETFSELEASKILRKKMRDSLLMCDLRSGMDRVWDIITGRSH